MEPASDGQRYRIEQNRNSDLSYASRSIVVSVIRGSECYATKEFPSTVAKGVLESCAGRYDVMCVSDRGALSAKASSQSLRQKGKEIDGLFKKTCKFDVLVMIGLKACLLRYTILDAYNK